MPVKGCINKCISTKYFKANVITVFKNEDPNNKANF